MQDDMQKTSYVHIAKILPILFLIFFKYPSEPDYIKCLLCIKLFLRASFKFTKQCILVNEI